VENLTIIDTPDIVKQFLELPQGIAKNYAYMKLCKEYEKVVLGKDGKDIYFSFTHYKISKNHNSYYSRISRRKGLSFKNGKLNLWYGSKIEEIPYLEDLFKEMNWNFIDKKAYSFITKTGLEKIFQGKITSTRDLLKHYAKSVRLKCSTDFLYKAVIEQELSKISFYMNSIQARDVDHFLQFVINPKLNEYNNPISIDLNYIVKDLREQYAILDKKIDFRWSEKRMKQEHEDATFELMKLQADNLSDDKIIWTEFNLPSNFDILNSEKRTFLEGSLMRHCVYTNYWYSIKTGRYLAFNVKLNNENATLGVELIQGKITFNQVYRYRNQPVSPEMRQLCLDFVESNKDIEVKIVNQIESKTEDEDFFY